ncbi:MAG: hypothetical protein VX189_12595, partial [Planctomycetota bacterium]|nr:hypothetical protein [Planctomycetota bacterium]
NILVALWHGIGGVQSRIAIRKIAGHLLQVEIDARKLTAGHQDRKQNLPAKPWDSQIPFIGPLSNPSGF